MDGIDIEIPDSEDAACALDVVESRLVRQGQYDAACDVISAQRRIRADADEIARLEAEIARLRKALVWAARVGGQGFLFVSADCVEIADGMTHVKFDGTDESLIETLCKLAEGE